MKSKALVSIGIPIQNGSKTIKNVLQSIVQQTYLNLEIIISDNASTDATYLICKEFSLRDARIKLFRQEYTLNMHENFKFVLEKSSGDYFMWAAADDYRSENFVNDCMITIINSISCAAVTSAEKSGDKDLCFDEITGDKISRISKFLQKPYTSYGFFYSITKTVDAKSFNFPKRPTLAFDWMYVCHLLSIGEIKRVHSCLTQFSIEGLSHSDKRFSIFRQSIAHWVYPVLYTSKFILNLFKNNSIKEKEIIFLILIKINFELAVSQCKFEALLTNNKIKKISIIILTMIFIKNRDYYFQISLLLKRLYKLT